MESEKMLVYIITVVFRFVVLHICISVHLWQTGTYKHANRQWHKGKTKLKICTLRTRPKSNRNILCLLCAFIQVDPRCIFFAFLCCFWLFAFLFISFRFVFCFLFSVCEYFAYSLTRSRAHAHLLSPLVITLFLYLVWLFWFLSLFICRFRLFICWFFYFFSRIRSSLMQSNF